MRWESLRAVQVERFVLARAAGQRPRSVQVGLTAVRTLLRWMCLEAMAPPGLADMIGSVAAWTPTALPKALTPEQVSPSSHRGVRRICRVLLVLLSVGWFGLAGGGERRC